MSLVEQYPEALFMQNTDHYNPFHNLCQSPDVPVELIQAFIDYDPTIVRIPEEVEGELPLHLASAIVVSGDVIRALIKAYPSSLKTPGHVGNLPLHDACRYNNSVEVIQVLIELFPDSIRTTNEHGSLPLHLACINTSFNNSVDKRTVVDTLIQFYPDSIYAFR
jgi:hypothetical protein